MTRPTADDVRRANMATLAGAHVIYVEEIRARYGKEGLEAIGEANRLHGIKLGEDAVKSGALRKGDPRSIYEFFEGGHPFFGFELEIAKVSKNNLDLKVTACPWIDTFKDLNAQSDICEWVCKIDEGIGQAVDPDFRMTLPKCMMKGDEYCIYRWEK
jgi:hypothetical protein